MRREPGRKHAADERARHEAGLAQRVEHAQLVAGELDVDIELDAGEGRASEVLERLLEGDRRALARVLVVVRDEQAPAAVGVLAEHVQLDHVDAVAQRGVEARERVAGLDVRGALVADAAGALGR